MAIQCDYVSVLMRQRSSLREKIEQLKNGDTNVVLIKRLIIDAEKTIEKLDIEIGFYIKIFTEIVNRNPYQRVQELGGIKVTIYNYNNNLDTDIRVDIGHYSIKWSFSKRAYEDDCENLARDIGSEIGNNIYDNIC